MDIGTLTNAPRTLTIGGRSYTMRALTFAELGVIQNWLKDNADDPVTEAFRQVDKAEAKGVPVQPGTLSALLTMARQEARQWPPRVFTDAWFDTLADCPGGTEQFLLAMFRQSDPAMTEVQAAAIAKQMDADESVAIVAAAMGIDTPPKDGPPAEGEAAGANAE